MDKSIDILNKRENSIIPAIIPVSGWDSLINSGDIALFTPDQSIQISDIYSEIRRYNYISERVTEEIKRDVYGPVRRIEPGEIPLFPQFKGELDQTAAKLLQIFATFKGQFEEIH
jgi:hypothetical protein